MPRTSTPSSLLEHTFDPAGCRVSSPSCGTDGKPYPRYAELGYVRFKGCWERNGAPFPCAQGACRPVSLGGDQGRWCTTVPAQHRTRGRGGTTRRAPDRGPSPGPLGRSRRPRGVARGPDVSPQPCGFAGARFAPAPLGQSSNRPSRYARRHTHPCLPAKTHDTGLRGSQIGRSCQASGGTPPSPPTGRDGREPAGSGVAEPLGHQGSQVVADRVGVPHRRIRQTLYRVRTACPACASCQHALTSSSASRPGTSPVGVRRGSTRPNLPANVMSAWSTTCCHPETSTL